MGTRRMGSVGALVLLVGFLLAVPLHGSVAYTEDISGTLHMYISGDIPAMEVILGAFEATYPNIELRFVRASAGEILSRIRAEADRPRASIWYVGPSLEHIAARQAGLTRPYTDSWSWQWMPDDLKCPDGYWAAMTVGMVGFVTNVDFLDRHGLEPPASWEDLLKPEFKNEIVMAYPYTSGTAYSMVAAIIQYMGEEKGFEYLEKLDQQILRYTVGGTAPIPDVGMGEAGVGIVFAHDILVKGIWPGYPVVMSFPKEGAPTVNAGAISLLNVGPDLEHEIPLAKLFYDWALSAEAQGHYAHENVGYIPVNPYAEVGEGVVTPADITTFMFDEALAGREKDRIIEKWRDITGK